MLWVTVTVSHLYICHDVLRIKLSPLSSSTLCSPAALMMSAFKAQGVTHSPASIKRTLSNTATPLGSHDAFSVGHGVIQVSCGPRSNTGEPELWAMEYHHNTGFSILWQKISRDLYSGTFCRLYGEVVLNLVCHIVSLSFMLWPLHLWYYTTGSYIHRLTKLMSSSWRINPLPSIA